MPVLRCAYPPATRGTIVVWGEMTACLFGGMIWMALHHLAAIRRLGFDVWYIEDSDRPMYELQTYAYTEDYSRHLGLLNSILDEVGLADRWAVRAPMKKDVWFGALSGAQVERLYAQADTCINLSGAQEIVESHEKTRCRVYLDTDPVSIQVAVAKGNKKLVDELDQYDFHFTWGENFGQTDCRVPIERYKWHKTRPQVITDWWTTEEPPGTRAFSTVASWSHQVKDVEWNNEKWRWSKHHQFERFIALPTQVTVPLKVAIGAISDTELQTLRNNGWQTSPASELDDLFQYRKFIQDSIGEFSPVKEQYLLPRSGWFSDRSVCYLAAGRPVIIQDTGFGRWIPTGQGLFAFSTEDEILSALDSINSDYPRHSAAALEIAQEYFSGEKLMARILETVGLL